MALIFNIHDDFVLENVTTSGPVFQWTELQNPETWEDKMTEDRPKAGDIVEYLGKYRMAMCECNDPGRKLWYETDDDTFDEGPYDSRCPQCHKWFWFDPEKEYPPSTGFQYVQVANRRKAHGMMAADEPSTLSSIAHLLPDVYGRKAHAQRLKREAEEARLRQYHKQMALGEKLGAIMDRHCGEARIDEPDEEPRKAEVLRLDKIARGVSRVTPIDYPYSTVTRGYEFTFNPDGTLEIKQADSV